ncbi:hypothetical protein IKF34_02180 [Candidatus Saccharibacteria bacterium]|nr:hypothetical protein [Candidatus Saccharibacteria bacterium]
MQKFSSVVVAATLAGLSLVSFLILSSSPTSATTSSATASVIVPVSCNLSTNIDSAHSATINNGTYKDNIGKTTLKVVCNDNSGFSIYAVGYSNDTFGNNKLVANVGGSLSPTNDIVTGTSTSGNTSNWAMKITPIAGTYSPTVGSDTNGSFANYHIVPDKYARIATFNSTTDATIGSSIEATYMAYVSGTQPAGTYTGKVKYTMVHPASEVPLQPRDATPRCISYWPNASGVVDSMADDCNSGPSGGGYGNNAYVDALWASNFKRPGYGFVGWSDKFDWVLNENDANGNGTGPNEGYHIYGPNATITLGDMSKGLSLYAVWAKSNGNLQGWNYCSALGTGKVTALTDQRDGNTYAVAKLADGKCWMIENLRLADQTPTGTTIELTTNNTNNPLNNGTSVTLKNTDSTTTNHLSVSTNPTTTAWCTSYNSACFDQSMLYTGNTTNPATNMSQATGQNIYSYGNYYNWYSATAGNGTYSKYSGNTEGDICPAGWHLPTGDTGGEFSALDTAIGGTGAYQGTTEASQRWRKFPNNFVYSGDAYGSTVGNQGSVGGYWSSTANYSYYAYYLYFGSSYVSPGTSSYSKYVGFMARCVLGS